MQTHDSSRRHAGLCLALLLMLCGSVGAQTKICYVDCDPQYSSIRGDSWETPLKSLQYAIDLVAKAGGGEVWVKAGVYKPEGKTRDATFVLKPNVKLFGGFRGAETDRSQRNPKANRTILSGDLGKTSDSDNCYHIVTAASESVLDGFIVSKGNANSLAEKGVGGGLFLPKGTRNFTAANCTFERNNAGWEGGAIYAEDAELVLTNCTFFSNTANGGAGLAAKGDASLKVTDCIFSANFATAFGGAVALEPGTKAVFSSTQFLYNTSKGHGGALAAKQTGNVKTVLELTDCIFNNNIAQDTAGAVSIDGEFYPLLTRCHFKQNLGANGVGAVGISSGSITVISDCTFAMNTGIDGHEDIGTDETSRTIDSLEALADLAPADPEEQEPVSVEAPKRSLPNVFAYQLEGAKTSLRGLVGNVPLTVLVLGDLTDPDFIKNYREIEAVARDYAKENVHFTYIYRYLLHPENNGYLQPFNRLERARQAQLAQTLLATRIPWLYDAMDNQTARALAPRNEKSIFVYSSDRKERFATSMSDASSLRQALANLAGTIDTPTPAGGLTPPKIKPINISAPDLLDRIRFDPETEHFQPLTVIPEDSSTPFYAKLRVEGNDAVLDAGAGKIYIGFHLDPLYKMEWDNAEEPLKYMIRPSKGLIAPSIASAPRIAQTSDAEPREFVLSARQLSSDASIVLRVDFSVYSPTTQQRTKVSQLYHIKLERDPCGGAAYRRQVAYDEPESQRNRKADTSIHPALRKYDANNDGKLTRGEVAGTLWSKFPEIDTNRDGYLNTEEYADFLRNR